MGPFTSCGGFSSGGHLLEIRTQKSGGHLQRVRNRASRLRDIPQILGLRSLFFRLRALRDKCCFRDTDVIAALNIISEQRRWFNESPTHRDVWTADLSAMVRSTLREVRQSDDLFAKRSVAAQALGHIDKSSRELARASGRNGAGRNADAAARAARLSCQWRSRAPCTTC